MNLFKEIQSFLKKLEVFEASNNNENREVKIPLIVILGPTASGKTKLSLQIAQEFGGEIISTDSRQIYQEMPISTDALKPEEQEGVPHHLIEFLKPDRAFTLAEYKDLANQKIQEISARKNPTNYFPKKIPMLVGGTGLYIDAIVKGFKVPKIPPNEKLREGLENEAQKHGNGFLHQKLQKLDPEAAKNIHPNNLRYVIRALEINLTTGKNKNDQKSSESPYSPFFIGIQRPREELYRRIEERVDLQVQNGLLDEAKTLLSRGYDLNLPSMTSLGIKEMIPYIQGKMTLDEAVRILKQNTRRYAKRQMTWFRKYDSVHWLKPNEVQEILKN